MPKYRARNSVFSLSFSLCCPKHCYAAVKFMLFYSFCLICKLIINSDGGRRKNINLQRAQQTFGGSESIFALLHFMYWISILSKAHHHLHSVGFQSEAHLQLRVEWGTWVRDWQRANYLGGGKCYFSIFDRFHPSPPISSINRFEMFLIIVCSFDSSGRKRFVSEGDNGLIKPNSMMFREY